MKNGKSYIGKTYTSIYDRLSNHLKDSKKFPNRPLYRAFNKHGLYSFSLEILGEFEQNILEIKESEAILEYNTFKDGYNATLGGEGRRYLSIPDTSIITKYKEVGTLTGTANYFKIDVDTVAKILRSSSIPINSKPIIGAIKVKIIDPNIEFTSFKECARFLIECELTKAVDIRGVASNIREACKNNTKYLGLRFEIVKD